MENRIFLGVDVAGANNTWSCALTDEGGRAAVWAHPEGSTLVGIRASADKDNVVAVAIDAQLTGAISEERGFRSSDEEIRRSLPGKYRNWVASANSLMAVPVRGRMLADALAPSVPTIIETHPRACLWFMLGADYSADIENYKKGSDTGQACARLAAAWRERFRIDGVRDLNCDGAVDALVCATVAYAIFHEPKLVRKLANTSADRRGRGPFCIVTCQV